MDNKPDFDSDYWDDAEMEYLRKHPHADKDDRPSSVVWIVVSCFVCVAVFLLLGIF